MPGKYLVLMTAKTFNGYTPVSVQPEKVGEESQFTTMKRHFNQLAEGEGNVILTDFDPDRGLVRVVRWHGPILLSTDTAVLGPVIDDIFRLVRVACRRAVDAHLRDERVSDIQPIDL